MVAGSYKFGSSSFTVLRVAPGDQGTVVVVVGTGRVVVVVVTVSSSGPVSAGSVVNAHRQPQIPVWLNS